MSYVKGSQLPVTSTVADTDTLIVTQEGDSKATKKATKSDLLKEDRARLTNLERENTTLKNNVKALEYVVNNSNRLNYTGQVITNSNSVVGDIKNVTVRGNTRYKKTDGTYTDTWESGVSLESVGEKEKDSNNKYPIEIVNCGKNLCKYNNMVKTVTSPDGNIIARVPLEIGRDYFISGTSKKTGSTGVVDGFGGIIIFYSNVFYDINTNFNYNAVFKGDYGDAIIYENASVDLSKKIKASKKYLYFYVGSGFYNVTFQITNLQVEEGTQATSYEPYKEDKRTILLDSPLRKTDSVVDVLDLGKSQITRKCYKVVFDGSNDENWTYAGNNIFALPFTGYKKVDLTTNSLLMCDKFTVTSHNVLNNISGNYIAFESSYTTDNYIKIRKPDTTDLTTFKTWLASNPVTIVYALATPTTEDIQVSPTDNPLQSYNGSTTLTLNNTIKGSISADIPTNVNAIIVNQASAIASLQDTVLQTQSALIENEYNNLI